MSVFPQTESGVAALATSMLTGYNEHATVFPNVDPLSLSDAINQYNVAKAGQEQASAAAKVATENKNNKLDTMIDLMKEDLKISEVDTDNDPQELSYIGWGAKDPRTPIEPPVEPGNLIAIFNGSSQLTLKWNKPAFDANKPVFNYVIQRRDQISQGSDYGDWFMVDMTYKTQATFNGQPSNLKMEYRVIATNSAGQSPESNSVCVVLK